MPLSTFPKDFMLLYFVGTAINVVLKLHSIKIVFEESLKKEMDSKLYLELKNSYQEVATTFKYSLIRVGL